MKTVILNDDQLEEFNSLTGIKASKIFISKGKNYYYATILEVAKEVKLRISKDLANKFI